MIEMNKVGEFMRSDVVDERERRLHQPPVETDMAAPGAAAPLRLRVGQGKTAGCAAQLACDAREPPGQQTFGAGQQPGAHQFIGIRIQRRIDAQRIAMPAYLVE